MSDSVQMPALGESVTEGTVTRWLKHVGDRVEVDEPLLEVSTDKVDTEIPSPVSGVLEQILVGEDETVAGRRHARLIGSGDGAAAAPAAPARRGRPGGTARAAPLHPSRSRRRAPPSGARGRRGHPDLHAGTRRERLRGHRHPLAEARG